MFTREAFVFLFYVAYVSSIVCNKSTFLHWMGTYLGRVTLLIMLVLFTNIHVLYGLVLVVTYIFLYRASAFYPPFGKEGFTMPAAYQQEEEKQAEAESKEYQHTMTDLIHLETSMKPKQSNQWPVSK